MIDYTIANEIKKYVDEEQGGYKNWYCGVASDLHQKLFDEHNVPRLNSWHIGKNAGNHQDARDTKNYLLSFEFDGDESGGDRTSIYVYAYKKIKGTTKES
jgi:hypothetical protein